MKVLFVCTGNTCRSPMLEFMFKHYLNQKGIVGIEVCSAGTMRHEKPVSRESAAVLTEYAVPFGEKISEYCSKDKVDGADFVFTMTDEQALDLKNRYGTSNKIIPLSKVIGSEVADPYGKGLDAYEDTYALFADALPKIYAFIAMYL